MFDVGINQLRNWLDSRRVYDPVDGWYPEVGDVIAVGCAMRPGAGTVVYVRSEVYEGETNPDYTAQSFESRGFEIWRVVDDNDCADCGYSDDYIRSLVMSPIRYDVMRFSRGRFQCVGANLDYATARDMVRRFERAGFVSYICESRHV